MTLELGDKVRVRAIPGSINSYRQYFEDRIGEIFEITPPRGTAQIVWYRVWFPMEANRYSTEGVFEGFELEKVST